jgi:hypothetical protein
LDDTKETKNAGCHFPRGNLEEILRMMRKCSEDGDMDCKRIMKEFMGREFSDVDCEQLKNQFFGENSKGFNFAELIKKRKKT